MDLARKFDGKKFMWDGVDYMEEAEARAALEKYAGDGFETRTFQEGGAFYVFTRRLATEIKVEGAP